MADFDADAIRAQTNLVELVARYVTLKPEGREYVGLCVAHTDKKPSMHVVPDKGFVHCFACGYHQDAIGFFMDVENVTFPEACKRLLNGAGTTGKTAVIPQRELKKPPKRKTSTPPAGTAPPDMRIGKLGAPSMVWTYRDTVGDTIGYVARYDTDDGKEIRVWSWGSRGGGDPVGWACGHFSDPRPLYGLDRLAARPAAQVIVTEGEKACDAAALLFPSMVAVTWPGGAQAIKSADWSPLKGRQVVLWPDNDEPGMDCMERLSKMLHAAGASEIKGLRVVSQPDGSPTPAKWDAADATFTPDDALAWAKPRVFRYAIDQDAAAAVTASQDDMPDSEIPPISAYSDAEQPQAGERSQVWTPTQQRPTAQRSGVSVDGRPAGETAASLGVLSRRMSDVTIRAIDWLWAGKIPAGKVTGISGNPGLGKSQITASLAAVVSTGGRWPVTRDQCQQGSVLLLNAEDDADDTLGPRLIAAGADLSKIHIIDAVRFADERGESVNRGLDLVRDIDRIAVLVHEIGDVRLVIIDPVSAYMGQADSHKMADVVGIMARLKQLASDTRCAIIMVNHLNKSAGQDALLKTQGSIGFVSHARAVWGVCKDKDNPQLRYFVPLKNNLGPDTAASSLAYQIEEFHLTDSDPLITTSRIMWENEAVTKSAQELMAAHDMVSNGDKTVHDECEEFLRDILQYGAVPVKEIEIAARKAGLHLNNTMRSAKAKLGITSAKQLGHSGQWVWQLPDPGKGRGSYRDRDG